jgi:hypothetical protein
MFKVILVFLVIYLVVRLVQSYSRENTARQGSVFNTQNSGRREGEVTVENKSHSKSKKVSNTEGEYINYEEL